MNTSIHPQANSRLKPRTLVRASCCARPRSPPLISHMYVPQLRLPREDADASALVYDVTLLPSADSGSEPPPVELGCTNSAAAPFTGDTHSTSANANIVFDSAISTVTTGSNVTAAGSSTATISNVAVPTTTNASNTRTNSITSAVTTNAHDASSAIATSDAESMTMQASAMLVKMSNTP